MIYLSLIIALIVTYIFYRRTIPELRLKRRIFLGVLRFISISLILLFLFNPILKFHREKETSEKILILDDISESMDFKIQNKSKTNYYEEFQEKILNQLKKKNYNIEVKTFANGLTGDRKQTKFLETISDLKKEGLDNTNEIILFSDGNFHDPDFSFLEDINLKISTFIPNVKDTLVDLEITDIYNNKDIYVNENTPFGIRIKSNVKNYEAVINVFHGNKKIFTKDIFLHDYIFEEEFEHIFKNNGIKRLHFEISTRDFKENNIANNKFEHAVIVKNNKPAIAFISDILNWDTAYFKKDLKELYMTNSYFMKNGEFYLKNQKINLEKILKNVNLLHLFNAGNLTLKDHEIRLLKNFIKQGGSIFIQGKEIKNFEIMPITNFIDTSFKGNFTISDKGKEFVSFKADFEQLPPVKYYYTEAKLGAEVLAEFDNQENSPAVIFNKFGKGRILYFPLVDLWKWQMWEEGNQYWNFVKNISAWLTNAEINNVMLLHKKKFLENDNIDFTLKIFDEKYDLIEDLSPLLEIKQAAKTVEKRFFDFDEDSYKLSMTKLDTGKYNYRMKAGQYEEEGSFIVMKDHREKKDHGINKALLSYIANKTAGNIYKENDEISFDNARSFTKETYHEIPLYKNIYLIGIFVVAFCTEIFLRKRWGLL